MKTRLLIIFLLLVLAVTACQAQPTSTSTAQAELPTQTAQEGYPPPVLPVPGSEINPAEGYPLGGGSSFEIVVAGGEPQPVNIDYLRSLTLTNVLVDNISLQGPTVLDALSAYRVEEFTEVTVTGESGSLTLSKTDLAGQVFAISPEGMVTMAKLDAKPEEIVRGVQRVEVR